MDSHAFRIAGRELVELLDGARLEKIQGPAPGIIIFTVFADGAKRRLVLRSGAQHPLLFFSRHTPTNPPRPYSLVMRLRKHAGGRRLGRGILDYSLRAIAFPILEGGGIVRYLLLDLKQGPAILPSLPEGFGREPAWPDESVIDACCDKPWDKKESSGAWQVYSVLSPLLRETLAALDFMEGRALMADLSMGGGCLFIYGKAGLPGYAATEAKATAPSFYCAWPLPESLANRRGLLFLGDTLNAESGFGSALEAVSAVDEPVFFHDLAHAAAKPEAREESQEKKRLKRLLAKLEQEEKRLMGMQALREDARLLQAQLWRFTADERLPEVCLSIGEETGAAGDEPEGEEHGADTARREEAQAGAAPGPGLRRIALDPLLTVRENMQRMFHQSSRGARGLSILEERRSALARELADNAGTASFSPERSAGVARCIEEGKTGTRHVSGIQSEASDSTGAWSVALPVDAATSSGGGKGAKHKLKDIAVFRSSDGYTMLRGKNAKGNHGLLKLAQPYDLWLHARGGPSAHLIIRKAHAADAVPERTLREGAILVGMKGWQRHDAKADIMVAYVKHVHPVKGAALGTVRVDEELQGLIVLLPFEREPG